MGHIVSSEGIELDAKKTAALVTWPKPVSMTDVQSFFRFTKYYRYFIPKYAQVAQLLNLLPSGENSTKERS